MGILSSALDAAIADQDTLITDIEIGGKKLKIGSKPLTPADFSAANSAVSEEARKSKTQYMPFQQDPTNFAGQIALLIRKARVVEDDELTDQKVFDATDLPRLRRLGVGPIADMFTGLFKDAISFDDDDEDGQEDTKGN